MLKRMFRRYVLLCQIVAAILWLGGPALGAWPVIDVRNLAQSIQQVRQTITMINNQAQQIQKQVQMVTQGAQMISQGNQLIALDNQMLRGFTGNYLGQIMSVIQSVDSLLQSTSGLTYDLASLSTAFDDSYRPNFGAMNVSQLLTKRSELRTMLLDTVKDSMTVQAHVMGNMGTHKAQLQDLVTASQAAPGQTSAIQAGNQLLAQIGGQLVEVQALLASQSKAAEAATAYQLAEAERTKEMARKSMVDQPYVTVSVGDPFSRVP